MKVIIIKIKKCLFKGERLAGIPATPENKTTIFDIMARTRDYRVTIRKEKS